MRSNKLMPRLLLERACAIQRSFCGDVAVDFLRRQCPKPHGCRVDMRLVLISMRIDDVDTRVKHTCEPLAALS